MPRHSKNNTASAVFSYDERKKLNWGTQKVRLGKDSIKDFDACCICLHQTVDPLLCSKGHLFCKGCIYESLLAQKQHVKAKLAQWEVEEKERMENEAKKCTDAEKKRLADFDKLETGILPGNNHKNNNKNQNEKASLSGYVKGKTASGKDVYTVNRDLVKQHNVATADLSKADREARAQYQPSFWLPSVAPDHGKVLTKKPSKHTSCPEGNHILKLKQLRPVKFTLPSEIKINGTSANKKKATHETGRYICPSCRKGLTNVVKSYMLRPCGHVMCHTCIDDLVRKDKACVDCGKPVRNNDKDIIKIQQGGTGFSSHGAKEVSSQVTPAFHCG